MGIWGGLGRKLGKLDASGNVSTNIYQGAASGDMKAGDVRLGILAGGTGSLGPGAIDLTLINAGLTSNSNGAKGTYYEALKIDAGLTPKFEIGATGKVIVTWSYQKREQ